jgi:hypothetical protein
LTGQSNDYSYVVIIGLLDDDDEILVALPSQEVAARMATPADGRVWAAAVVLVTLITFVAVVCCAAMWTITTLFGA